MLSGKGAKGGKGEKGERERKDRREREGKGGEGRGREGKGGKGGEEHCVSREKRNQACSFDTLRWGRKVERMETREGREKKKGEILEGRIRYLLTSNGVSLLFFLSFYILSLF